MKIAFSVSMVFLFACTSAAQTIDYAYVDQRMLSIPFSATQSVTSIAGFINENFITEKEKFRGIHYWVSHNIRYDTDSMYVFNWGADPEKKVTAALRRRKGVCENFTAIFHAIATACKLESYIVSGFTKQSGRIDKVGHTWCAVKAESQWFFCDPTWDEQYQGNPNYFLVTPSEFIQSHMPFDYLWQLSTYPLSKETFYSGGNDITTKEQPFHFTDSVTAFLALNELQRLEATIKRIKQKELLNDLEITNLAFTEMLANIIYEDRDMNLYNSAVDDINKATSLLNEFIEYRNRQFTPLKSDTEMKVILLPAISKLEFAQRKLERLDQSVTNAQYDTYAVKERLNNLRSKLNTQQDFLQRYILSSPETRLKLFYN